MPSKDKRRVYQADGTCSVLPQKGTEEVNAVSACRSGAQRARQGKWLDVRLQVWKNFFTPWPATTRASDPTQQSCCQMTTCLCKTLQDTRDLNSSAVPIREITHRS